MESDLSPTTCPECGSIEIRLEEDYGRKPIVTHHENLNTYGILGDLHSQDWICDACGHDWRVTDKFGESAFAVNPDGTAHRK